MIKKFSAILALWLIMGAFGLQAQERHDWEKIKSLKIAFLTEKLELTAQEAQAFWPIYNEYEAKKIEFHKKEFIEVGEKIKTLNTLSDAEATELLRKIIKLEAEKQQAEKNYIEKVAKNISPKKTIRLLLSEDEFKRKLIKQFRDKKER